MKLGLSLVLFFMISQSVMGAQGGNDGSSADFNRSLRTFADQGQGVRQARLAAGLLETLDSQCPDNQYDVEEFSLPVFDLTRKLSSFQERAGALMKQFGRPDPLSLSCLNSFNSLCSDALSMKRHHAGQMQSDGPLVEGAPMIDHELKAGSRPSSFYNTVVRDVLVTIASQHGFSTDRIPSPLELKLAERQPVKQASVVLPRAVTLTDCSDVEALAPVPFAHGLVPVPFVNDGDDEDDCYAVPLNTARQSIQKHNVLPENSATLAD